MRMRVASVVLAFGLAMGCATVQQNPTGADQARARELAATAAIAGTNTLDILNLTDKTIDQLPLPVADKNAFSCAILKVIGAPTVTPAVIKTCGFDIKETKDSALRLVSETLRKVTTCASLKSSANELIALVDPIINDFLAKSTNPALVIALGSLQTTLRFLRSITTGGVTCV